MKASVQCTTFLPKDVLNNLHVNENFFTYEKMELIKTHFQREAEMANVTVTC